MHETVYDMNIQMHCERTATHMDCKLQKMYVNEALNLIEIEMISMFPCVLHAV